MSGRLGSVGWPGWLAIAIAVACVLAYLPALGGEPLFDDFILLRYDCWHGLDRVPAMFGFDAGNACTYRPVRWASFALDYSVAGPSPFAHHLANVVYHLVTAGLVMLVARRFTRTLVAAVLVAGLWALHPVNADAVAYISGRRDILMALFFLGSYLLLAPRGEARRGVLRLIAGLFLFFLAVRAKEMAVTLPALLLWSAVSEGAGREGALRAHLRRRWPVYLVLLSGVIGVVAYRGFLDTRSSMSGDWWGGSPTTNFATAFSLYPRYFALIVWPDALVGDYFTMTIPIAEGFGEPATLLGMVLYGLLVALVVVALRRGWRATAFGIGWFLITMLPVSHILPHHEIFAEHYLYLPLIGLLIAVSPLLERALAGSRRWRRPAVGAIAVSLVALGVRTGVRAGDYSSRRAFYQRAHELAPDNSRAGNNLGLTFLDEGDCERAVPLMLEARRYVRRLKPMAKTRVTRFIECGQEIADEDAPDALARELLDRDDQNWLAMAWLASRELSKGDPAASLRYSSAALALPTGRYPEIGALYADALNSTGNHTMALEFVRSHPGEQVGLREQEVRALLGLGRSRYREALTLVESYVEAHPDSLRLIEYSAALYFSSRQRDLGLQALQRLEELGADEDTLARVRGWSRAGP